jgi:RHS repeat-associated protein
LRPSYTFDDKGVLTQVGNAQFGYNIDGSRAVKTVGSDHWDYAYNNQGLLQSVTKNNSEVIGTYGYDLSGWRIWKVEDGKTNIYVRDDNQVYYQETFNGTDVGTNSIPETSRSFVYFGNELLGSIKNGLEAKYYINDHLGTTELVTDGNGNITSQIQHTPFGDEVLVQSGTSSSDNSDDYFFTGKEKDATGLYYFGGRYYDPEIGRFISEDPGKDSGDWFAFCRNNPLNMFDPDGCKGTRADMMNVFNKWIASKPMYRLDWSIGAFIQEFQTHLLYLQQVRNIDLSKLTINQLDYYWKEAVEIKLLGMSVADFYIGMRGTGNKEVIASNNTGTLVVEPGEYSSSELNSAKYLYEQGYNVRLRQPIGTRAGGGTSDLLVNGKRYDVYTPTSSNPNRIIGGIADKNSQAVGIILDLSKTSVTAEQLGNILLRVRNAGATNIIDIMILP